MKNPFSALTSGLSGDSGRLVDPYLALPVAAALIGGNGNSGGMSNALMAGMYGMQARRENRDAQAQRNQTLEYFMNNRPDLYEQVQAGLPVSEAFKLMNQKPDHTDDMREYQMAQEQGFEGNFMDYMTTIRRAGADRNTSVGSIPQGFQLQETADGLRMVPIPGGPADMEAQEAARIEDSQDQKADRVTGIITRAAKEARTNAAAREWSPRLHNIARLDPASEAAQVEKYAGVLKSVASAENLNEMRRQSKTGGALGNVTEKELLLLERMSGALDPRSPNFMEDLDEYERVLLQTVHGKDAGDRIYEQTREKTGGKPADMTQELWDAMTPDEKALWQN